MQRSRKIKPPLVVRSVKQCEDMFLNHHNSISDDILRKIELDTIHDSSHYIPNTVIYFLWILDFVILFISQGKCFLFLWVVAEITKQILQSYPSTLTRGNLHFHVRFVDPASFYFALFCPVVRTVEIC